jgi:hypothetical protein
MSNGSIASRSARLVYGHFNRFYPHFLAAKRFKERLAFRSFGKEDPAMVAEQDCAVGQRNVSPATSKLFFAWPHGSREW